MQVLSKQIVRLIYLIFVARTKKDYTSVRKQKFWYLPHKFMIFWHRARESRLINLPIWLTVRQRSYIWSFKVPRLEAQLINQFSQPEFLSPTSQIIQVLCTSKKMGLSGCKPWKQRKYMSLNDKVITQELSKIAASALFQITSNEL